MPNTADLDLTGLTERIPADRVATSAVARAAFQSDGLTAFASKPQAVVTPLSIEEVKECVRWCHRHSVPFVARGSGTSLSGAALPHSEGIVIALNRLDAILDVDPKNRLAVVQTGVINSDLSKAVSKFGLHYAPDPSSQQVCTIGGNIAFNAGGAHCLKYGMTGNHVLSMRVVLADGNEVVVGHPSGEVDGPDLASLTIGSEGLLGIVVEATVKLMPVPEKFYTVLAGFDRIQQAGEAVSRIIASGLLPAAMEIMDRTSMRAAKAGVGAEYPEGVEAVLIVELDGNAAEVSAEQEILDSLLAESEATAVEVAQNAEQRASIWKGRKSVFSAVGRLSPDFLVQDGVVPRSQLGEALSRIEALAAETGIAVANVFHAGDGNLHPLIMFDAKEHQALARAESLAAKILEMCIELGGSVTGEHGVGIEKTHLFAKMFNEDSLDCMKRLRMACDPGEIANRGKMFPSAEAPALSTMGLHDLEKAGVAERM